MNKAEGEEIEASYRGIIIFLVIFAIISITSTTVISNLYIAKNQVGESKYPVISGEKEELGDIGRTEVDTTYVLGLDEFYTTNNLQITEKYFFSGDVVIPSEYDYIRKYEENIDYIEIDGLKDEVIEDKINEDIKNKAFNILNHKDINKYKIAETDISVEGNFSNILSIEINSYIYNESLYDGIRETFCLNYNLTNGEQIKLEEIFADGASIKEIFTENLYYKYAQDESWWAYNEYIYNHTGKECWDYYEDGTLEEDIKKYGLMSEEKWIEWKYRSVNEERVLGSLLEMRNSDIRFLISPSYIRFEIGNDYNSLWIKIREIYDKIALYKKFMTNESIFTDEYQVSKIGMCGMDIWEGERIYFPTENMLLFEHFYNSKEKPESTITKLAREKIDADIEYIKKNKNKFFIANVNVNNEDWSYEKLEIDMQDYVENKDSVLKPISMYEDWAFRMDEKLKELDINYIIYDYKYANINNLGYIFNSDVRLLSSEELEKYDVDTLNLAYNEIFARHGHDFVTKSLRAYFGTQIWYKPVAGRTVSLDELSDIEIQNLNLIKAKINEKRG